MNLLLSCIGSFLITALITPLAMRAATACNCIDRPGGRRRHKKPTPRWGGVAFFAGVLPFLHLQGENDHLLAFCAASVLLVAIGMIDDLRPLGWRTKMAAIGAATTVVIFGGDLTVHHLGSYGSLGRVELEGLSIPFTYLSIIGVTNAINLLDGLNGLAGGVSLLAFLFMGVAALISGNLLTALICFSFVGAIGAFLLFNFPSARIFMGDTGSTFLGFSLACTAVLLTQHEGATVDAVFPVLVLLLPIFDTLRVLSVRLLSGKHPFRADNLHLHYRIVQQEVSPVHAVLLFWLATSAFGIVGLAVSDGDSAPLLALVLQLSLLLALFAAGLPGEEEGEKKSRVKGIPDFVE